MLFFATLMCMVACGTGDQEATHESAGEAGGETAASGFQAMKAEYVAATKTMVDEWNTKIEELVAKKSALPEMAQQKLEEPMTALLDQRDNLNSQFEKVQGAGEETFATEKTALETTIGELRGAYDGVAALF
jgi:hypothetical protein